MGIESIPGYIEKPAVNRRVFYGFMDLSSLNGT